MALPLIGLLAAGAAGLFGSTGRAIAGGAGEQYSDLYAQDRRNIVSEKLDYLKRKRLMDDAEALSSQKELMQKKQDEKKLRAELTKKIGSIQSRINKEDYPYLNFAAQNGEDGLDRFVKLLDARDKNPNLQNAKISNLFNVDATLMAKYLEERGSNFNFLNEAVNAYMGDVSLDIRPSEKTAEVSKLFAENSNTPLSYVGTDLVLTAALSKFNNTNEMPANIVNGWGITTKAELEKAIKNNKENPKKSVESAVNKGEFNLSTVKYLVNNTVNAARVGAGTVTATRVGNDINYANISLEDILSRGADDALMQTRMAMSNSFDVLRNYGVVGFNRQTGVVLDSAYATRFPKQANNQLFKTALGNQYQDIIQTDLRSYVSAVNHFATNKKETEIPYVSNTFQNRTVQSYQGENTQIFKLPINSLDPARTDVYTLNLLNEKFEQGFFSGNTFGDHITSFQNGAVFVDKNDRPFGVHIGGGKFVTFGETLSIGSFGKNFINR